MIDNRIFEELLSYRTVIVANGEAPFHPYSVEILKRADNIICCDGAIRHLESLGLPPTAIVGDGDSMSDADKSRYAYCLFPDKSAEYNDLTKAFNYCREHQLMRVAIIGGFGLREDHALANLSIVLHFGLEFDTAMITNYGIFTPAFQTTSFNSFAGQQVSVFCFSPNTPLTFYGLKYPVVNRVFHDFWEGSLNEALATDFTIEFSAGRVLVYRTFN